MITLLVYNSMTFFDGPEDALEEFLYPALRVKDKNAYWKAKFLLKKLGYFSDIGDEDERQERIEKIYTETKWLKFYDKRSDSFLTGLLPRVLRRFEKHDVAYELDDRRTVLRDLKPIKRFDFLDKVEERQEQIEVINAALREKRGILHCATNFGKTEVAAAIIAACKKQLGRLPNVLFLVHRVQLVKQTAERFKKHMDIPVAMIGSGHKEIPKHGVLVATIQTALNVLASSKFTSFLADCNILFIDEFHVNKAWACTKIVKKCSAGMRFGLSGTIDESNKAKMMHYVGMTGPVIASVRNVELVDLGRSARPIARFIEFSTATIPTGNSYPRAYRLGIVRNSDRNRTVVKEILRHLKKNRSVLVTVARIEHGHILKGMLDRRIDLRIEYVNGSTPVFARDKVLKDFQRKRVSVLIASPIFDVGVDIPEGVDAWVNAAGGIGWELVLQRLGRVLRKKKRGKNVVYISDFIDKHNHYLFKHSLARIDHYRREKVVKIRIVEDEHA